MALKRITAMSADDFRGLVLGRRHLHTGASDLASDFTDLFSPASLEELLSGGMRTSSLRLVRSGVEGDVGKGCIPESGDAPGTAPFPSTDRIRTGLAAGQTLIIRSLHRFHAPIRRFAHELSAELGYPVKVNAFVTPPNSQGVDLHYDVQDVVVLQIAGSKRWLLRKHPLRNPLPEQAWFDIEPQRREKLRAASEPLDELTLHTGDSLYFPRGTMHSPMTQDQLSIHLTVAITKTTHHDLLGELVRRAVDDEWLRESVELAELEADPEAAGRVLGEIGRRLAAFSGTVSSGELLWAVRKAAFREHTPEPVPVLPSDAVPSASLFAYRRRVGAHFLAVPDGDGLMLSVGSLRARLPSAVGPVLDALRRDPELDQRRLTEVLGENNARKVTAALVDMGLLQPVAYSDALNVEGN